MQLALVVLFVCACGRLEFDANFALAITSPDDQAEVAPTATVSGTCMPGVPVAISGSGVDTGSSAPCEAGDFAATVTFSQGYGEKVVTVSQGAASATRVFLRIEHVAVRATSSGAMASQGFNVDCDLVVPVPAGTSDGDLLVGMIYTDGGVTGSISTPGFTRRQLAAPTYVAFTKRASSEPTSYTFRIVAGAGGSDTCESAGTIVAFTGVPGPDPVLAESGDASLTAPGVEAPAAALLVGVFGSNGPATGIHAPPGMTKIGSADGTFASALIASEVVAAGSTGSRTATIDVAREAAAGLMVLGGVP